MVNGQCMREHRVRLVASQRRYVRQIQPTTHRRWGIFARPSPPSRKLLGSTVRTHSKERRERLKSDHPAFSERRPKPPSGRLTHSPKPVLPNPSRPVGIDPRDSISADMHSTRGLLLLAFASVASLQTIQVCVL